MKSKGILFKPDMIRAILESRKTQTRRVIRPQPDNDCYCEVKFKNGILTYDYNAGDENTTVKAPYQPGDVLYVKETFTDSLLYQYVYKADVGRYAERLYKWKSALFMPRQAALQAALKHIIENQNSEPK